MNDSTTPQKTCSRCGDTKPATSEHFYRMKETRDGLRPDCKECLDKKQRAHYVANKERIDERHRAYREANKEQSAEYNREYYAANRNVIIERVRRWGIDNKEQKRKNNRAYDARNRERNRARRRAYRVANAEREAEYSRNYYIKNKEIMADRQRAYLAKNPEKARQRVSIRRARRLQAEGAYTIADVQAQYERQKGRCYWCNVKVGNTYDVDHIVPLSRGGTDWPENIVIACPSCNRSRGDKLPHEWPQGGRLL